MNKRRFVPLLSRVALAAIAWALLAARADAALLTDLAFVDTYGFAPPRAPSEPSYSFVPYTFDARGVDGNPATDPVKFLVIDKEYSTDQELLANAMIFAVWDNVDSTPGLFGGILVNAKGFVPSGQQLGLLLYDPMTDALYHASVADPQGMIFYDSGGYYPDVGTVTIGAEIVLTPEPATLSLLALGAVAIARRRRSV